MPGLRGFTHLFNAMSPLGNREPGVVGAALEDDAAGADSSSTACTSIPVDAAARAALQAAPTASCWSPTRCRTSAANQRRSRCAGKRIVVHDGKLLDEAGTLAGRQPAHGGRGRNAIELLDVDLARAARMAGANPAAFLRLDAMLGRIAPGYSRQPRARRRALNVLETWIDGESSTD